jgi:hypothetical protein
VYRREWVQAALGLPKSTLAREVRLGRLNVCLRAGRHYFLGSQLLAWLKAGERRRRGAAAPPPATDTTGTDATGPEPSAN